MNLSSGSDVRVNATNRSHEFGVFLAPDAASYPDLLRQVDAAETGGLDLIGIQDHPYQARFLDTFVLISDLLARTEHVRIFPDVANLPLRPPAMLAKLSASLDVMSGGRFELGLGAGRFRDAIAAMGGPNRSAGESIEALEEGISIIRAAWASTGSVSFEGRHYSVRGFHPGPTPVHGIGIWVGALKPRMLRLTGRLGDGWIPSLSYTSPAELLEMRKVVDDAALGVGRDPADIRRLLNVAGAVAESPTRDLLVGPPQHWIEQLTEFAETLGFNAFIFAPAGDPLDQVRRFASDVVPGVREGLAKLRATNP